MPKITKRIVDAITSHEARRFYVWDDQIKGFGILVLPSGVKILHLPVPNTGRTRPTGRPLANMVP